MPESNPSLDSALDAILAPAADTTPTTDVSTPAETTPAGETPAVTPEAAPVVDPAKPAAEEIDPATGKPKVAAPAAEEDNLDDTDIDEALKNEAQSTNPLDLKSSRGKRIYGAYKAYKEISEATGEDLTVERVTQLRDAFVDNDAMQYEFSAGDPARSKNFLGYWNKTSPEGMVKLAEVLPDTLAQLNPQAYLSMSVPVLNGYARALYTRAQVESNPEIKQALTYVARMVDWDLNNKFKSDDELAKPTQPQVDPRTADVERKYNEIQRFQQSQAETSRTSWINNLDETNSRMLEVESDKVLAPLKAAYPSERLYSAARKEFIEAVIAQVAKDPNGEQLYSTNRNRALARLSSEDIPVLAKQYENRASRVIRAMAPGFLKEAGVAAKSQSDTRNSQLSAAAAAGKSPQSVGAPVPQSIVPGAQRKFASKGEEFDSKVDELFR